MNRPQVLRFLCVYLPLYFVSGHLATPADGASDTMLHYQLALACALVALAAAIAWSALRRGRTNDDAVHEVHQYLRTFLRYVLAFALIGYGVSDVFQVRFPPLVAEQFLPPLGMLSPTELLWKFMGYSYGYNVFTGLGELLGGALLFSRRTTTLGGLVACAVLTNAVMLNFSYDAPAKLLSLHLLLAAAILLAPEFKRLADLFVFQSAVAAVPSAPAVNAAWSTGPRIVSKTVLVASAVLLPLGHVWRARTDRIANERLPLNGIYAVERFVRGRDSLPQLTTDSSRWSVVIIDGGMTIQTMDGSLRRYTQLTDTLARRLNVRVSDDRTAPTDAKRTVLTYSVPDPQHLILDGVFFGDSLHATLRRADVRSVFGVRGVRVLSAQVHQTFLSARPSVTLLPAALDRYVGEYKSTDFSMVVTRAGDSLFEQATGQSKLQLFPGSESEFFISTNVNARITFERDSAGAVTSLMFSNTIGDRRAPKVK